jgi:hypothetical protein
VNGLSLFYKKYKRYPINNDQLTGRRAESQKLNAEREEKI